MAQIFHPSMNTLARASIFGAIFIAGGLGVIVYAVMQSPYVTDANVVRDQPVAFSHDHHVRGLGIDCRYCHTSVENSAFAGLPATKTCMTCHSQIWANSEMLRPVRQSWESDQPLQWTRVHDLPDYAYFNHSIHVAKGIGCATCHGEVDTMPLMWQAQSLTMSWCLDCHRQPEKYIRPASQVFNMRYTAEDYLKALKDPDPKKNEPVPPELQGLTPEERNSLTPERLGEVLVEKYGVKKGQLLNCSVCHR